MNQSLPPLEIVVVDDASSVPFAESLAETGFTEENGVWRKHDIRGTQLRVIRLSANRGAAAARQVGIHAAEGDFIAFLDSDDIWLPSKLANQTPLLGNQGEMVIVTCSWVRVDGNATSATLNERVMRPVESADPKDFAMGCWYSPGSTAIVPRVAFDQIGGFNLELRRLEDFEWFLRFARAGGRLRVASHIGARIAHGRRARSIAVEPACRMIEEGVGLQPGWERDRRYLTAFLELERAAAARNDGNWRRMVLHLIQSWIACPRARLQLRPWWHT